MQKVYLLTQTFPLAPGEDSFITPELEVLKHQFDVMCVPLDITGNTGYSGDVTYINSHVYTVFDKISALLRCFFQKRFYLQLADIIKTGQSISKGFLYTTFVSYKANLFSFFLDKKVFRKEESAIVYSYWFNEACLAAVSLQKKYPLYKFITRTHGYDLFDFRVPASVQPFKMYMDKRLSAVIFVCQMAKDYFLERYQKADGDKYIVSYLGVKPQTTIAYAPQGDVLNIVSCSNVIPLKRIQLIIQSLSLVDDIKIHWSHFGQGELLEDLKLEAKNLLTSDNIRYKFYGYVGNSEYIQWLKNNAVQIFITLSSTEALPVSIMEAYSLGIPCIATAAGGIDEIVNMDNGILLPLDPTPQQVKTAITDFFKLSPLEKRQKSDNAYKIWQTTFNAEANSLALAKIIHNL